MALAFWRKTKDIAPENAQAVAVTEDTPLPVVLKNDEDDEAPKVQLDQLRLPPVGGDGKIVGPVRVTGIGTGSAYTAGDAFGGVVKFPNCFRPEKCSGWIVGALYYDLDDEGLAKDVPLYSRAITATTDNDAYALADADNLYGRGFLRISDFFDGGSGQIGMADKTTVPFYVVADGPDLWTQLRTLGADNVAAASEPWIALLVVPD